MKDLAAALATPEGPARTAALVAWVQGLFPAGQAPVLVGGAAVELYTGGAYTTGDLDFVGHVSPSVAGALLEAGFRRQGRHWLREDGQSFLEFPSSSLHEGEKAARHSLFGSEIVVVTPEDLIAERLDAWQHWRSAIDGVNAWLVRRARGATLDSRRLRAQSLVRDCIPAPRSLQALARRAASRAVTAAEIEQWARSGG